MSTLDSVIRDIYASPMLRELEGIDEATSVNTDWDCNRDRYRIWITTEPDVHTSTSIRARDVSALAIAAPGAFTRLLHVRLRSLALRHFAAWSVGAYPGWRI